MAEKFWMIAKDYGAKMQVECWEVDVPDGKTTDFRRAVKCEDSEKIVFSWVTWDNKQAADTGHDKMMADPRMAEFGKPRSEEHTSELQSLMRISYAVFCLKKKKQQIQTVTSTDKQV